MSRLRPSTLPLCPANVPLPYSSTDGGELLTAQDRPRPSRHPF
jgi:hypothetical protein